MKFYFLNVFVVYNYNIELEPDYINPDSLIGVTGGGINTTAQPSTLFIKT